MGASRKLQGEIDRVLKKVQEGVEVFDSIWNKVYDTDNANQKEKFEADLKKEIKKLQRYRDQIKTWIQSSEIKDKKVSASYEQALVDARKLIEREMERFKICEKETKTKAFSKEGLGQQPKTDPKEKAKSETRDWLNNVVGELESQIDNFEAELEGLSVKKGKSRPPRLTHLETSITRHKAHIKKCEFILRLLDNDELSPEQVNDVKDFLDDYVERNQEDFDEFNDVDELYSSLPLDKVETLEDLVTIPTGLSKVAPSLGVKNSSAVSTSQSASASASQTSEQADDTASQDSNSDNVAKTPPPKSGGIGSTASTPTGNHTSPISVNVSSHTLSSPPAVAAIPSSNSVRNVLENSNVSNSSSVNQPTSTKEEDINSFPSRRPSPSLSDATLLRGRNSLSNQATASIPLGSANMVPSNGALGSVSSASEIAKRNMLAADDRLGSSAMVQPLVSPISNRLILPQAAKANDGTVSVDSGAVNDAATAVSGRVFSPSVVPGMQWRPGSPFQNQSDAGQLRGRTEIAPDQREKFLQKYQQVQQGHSTLLNMPSLVGGNHKQFSAQQQNPLLQQFNSHGSSVSSQSGIGLGVQSTSLSGISSASLQQPPNSVHSPSSQQSLMPGVSKDSDGGNSKSEEQQQHQNFPDEPTTESTASNVIGKNLINEDDSKSAYAVDSPVCHVGVSASLPESAQTSRDIDLSPGQPLQSNQPTGNLGVIGRRNGAEHGAIGDSFSASSVSSGGVRDQLYNLQMLEAAHFKIPLPKDSERPRSYTPKHPTITPPSYPQVQSPIVNNPAFWERVGLEPFGTDTLFFAFYYQQNTYQQYLAAKELKKQSWRYHRKYNTWFQRHEEPKVATDEYEQGTYVYFDFHIANDDMQHGWCQRIKTEFTFEYNYLEDDLLV
ncbi:general negative regulator of transcription subunit 3-like isoform X1 [Vigna radiata var. radiata]|uniref:General negative regulator of transcription subunit 3-like isoform X1 n=1 Tax=Vigna radiata var. radiata TaxID=3916 RepID=A0A1S3TBY9_VIGRR|nr:general negative regulator of transcription subunit 3-like isoform X1 [Vigna radiata var. radiata]XP_022633501.1 general negative regulator of transcription subunit 3-like isoform X1 [Vigna radiata var. radiata]